MTTSIGAGSMVVIDDTTEPPVVVFDSSEKLFTCLHLISGDVTIPERQATISSGGVITRVNIDNYHQLGNIDANANAVLGSFSVTTYGGTQGLAGLGVFNAGGTYVHLQQGNVGQSQYSYANKPVVQVAAYTFIASGGLLYLNERVYLDVFTAYTNPIQVFNYTLLSVRFDYKLFIGSFV